LSQITLGLVTATVVAIAVISNYSCHFLDISYDCSVMLLYCYFITQRTSSTNILETYITCER